MVNTCTSVNFSRTLKPDDNIYKIQITGRRRSKLTFLAFELILNWAHSSSYTTLRRRKLQVIQLTQLRPDLITAQFSLNVQCASTGHSVERGSRDSGKNYSMLGKVVKMA